VPGAGKAWPRRGDLVIIERVMNESSVTAILWMKCSNMDVPSRPSLRCRSLLRIPHKPGVQGAVRDTDRFLLEVRMTDTATGTAQEDPFKVGAMAYRRGARTCGVVPDVPGMLRDDVAVPGLGMGRGWTSQMATGARGAASGDPFEVGAVTRRHSAARRAVLIDELAVQCVGEGAPLERMHLLLVAQVAIAASHLRNAAA
jgi:hypothetical protein